MGNQVSRREMVTVGVLNVCLFIAAAVTFYSGLSMSWYHGEGLQDVSHGFLPGHLVFGLIFIGLGFCHVFVNRWWCKKARAGEVKNRLQLAFMPVYVILFLFMAVTALLIWLFGIHDCVAMHKICGYVFLGFVTIHAVVRYGIK